MSSKKTQYINELTLVRKRIEYIDELIFIRKVMNNEIKIIGVPIAEIYEQLDNANIPHKIYNNFKVSNMNKDYINNLEDKIQNSY